MLCDTAYMIQEPWALSLSEFSFCRDLFSSTGVNIASYSYLKHVLASVI